MADQALHQCSNSSSASEETSDSTLELNIKTLDSQTYTFQVNKNMLVSLFKEKIANEVGVPVAQQRLIFRGRVLKDDHPLSEYHLENGHTLHLVVRQMAESQPPSDAGSGETTTNDGNRDNDTYGGVPRNPVGQIAHSVVLGTVNVGDQGDNVVPDFSRVIGAVLNSFGIGTQAMNNSTNGMQSTVFAQTGNVSDGAPAGISVQGQAGNNMQPRQAIFGQPFQASPQVVQIPVTAAAAIPMPSIHMPIPDSLDTLLEFIRSMEQTLSQNGYPSDASTANSGAEPRGELPRNRRGPSTPESLSVVLRNAHHLLSGQASAVLSHIAGRLEQEGGSSDPALRGQIQTEATQAGLAMQHLGALLLELGRTILTLRMGQSPAESYVNSGPAVYISSSGPNPIMVQPFLLQTSSLFSDTAAPSTPVTVGPVGIGTAPRHINIHIHAVGNRQSTGDGGEGGHENNTGSANAGSVRVLPVRNVIATAVPSHATSAAMPTGGRSEAIGSVESVNALRELVNNLEGRNGNASGTESSEIRVSAGHGVANAATEQPNRNDATGRSEEPISTGAQPERDLVNSINTRIRELVSNMQGRSDSASGIESSEAHVSVGRGLANAAAPCGESVSNMLETTDISCSIGDSSAPCGESVSNVLETTQDANPSKNKSISVPAMGTPLGLGLGGLERKKQSKQAKPVVKNEDSGPSAPSQPLPEASGQQLLQSLFSGGSASNNAESDKTNTKQASGNRSRQDSDNGVDVSAAMSQVLESPALDGLLGGISRQAGVGSPNILRNMMQQLTQNPQIMNTVTQIAQQVDGQGIENMMSGGGAQGGQGFDFSRIVQQMMPMVSRAFSQGGPQAPAASQVNVQSVAQMIEHSNAPEDVFCAIVENASQIPVDESIREDLVDEILCEEGLAEEYAGLLRRDIQRRFQGGDSSP